MKHTAIVLISSLLSALIAVWIYDKYFPNEKIIFQEADRTPVQYAKLNELDSEKSAMANLSRYRSALPTDFIGTAKLVTQSVVNIRSLEDKSFNFWGNGEASSTGSGVIISPDGYLVTNNHVVDGADKIEVTLNDKRKFHAELKGTDRSTDLALLKIDEESLPFLQLGNSDSVSIGEWVLAVGNPFNLTSTVTAGIVSAKGRSINILDDIYSIESFIQTDAAVNPGNSGGALVNTKGELVGINTAIMTRSGRYEGYSFAIPSTLASKVIKDLMDFGIVQRGILGVEIGNVNQEIAADLDLPKTSGVLITNVHSNSGAEDSGLQPKDVIVSINSVSISSVPELQEQVGRFRPGDAIKVEYIRSGKKYKSEVVLKTRGNSTSVISSDDYDLLSQLGFELRDLTRREIAQYKIKGIKVISIVRGSKIDRTNMEPGFIITMVNDEDVKSVEEFINMIQEEDGRVLLGGYYEYDTDPYYYAFNN